MHRAQLILALAFLAATIQLSTCNLDLDKQYPYSEYLEEGYKVHWNYDLKKQTIKFAVNVSTNGWIGFGISPTSKMFHSDIVIGWVNKDGSAQFHVSIASYR